MGTESKRRGKSVSNYIFYFLILLIVLAAAALLLPAYRQYRIQKKKELRLEQRARRMKTEREKRHAEVEALENSPAAVEKVAREKFNLVKEGETVLVYKK